MSNRKGFLFILIGVIVIVTLFIIITSKKKDDLTDEQAIERIEDIYERELSSSEELQ